MVVPPNHPNLMGFFIINHPFWGTTIFGNTHMFNQKKNMKFQISPQAHSFSGISGGGGLRRPSSKCPSLPCWHSDQTTGFQSRTKKSLEHGKSPKEHENELSNFIFQFSSMFFLFFFSGCTFWSTQDLYQYTHIYMPSNQTKKSRAKNKPWIIKETLFSMLHSFSILQRFVPKLLT